MSFAARLIHPLVIVRTPLLDDADDRDEHGNPVPGTPTLTSVRGLVQPRSVREVPSISQAGTVVADYVIFLPILDLIEADAIEHDPDDGRRYEIIGIRRYEFGRSPHLEVDVRMVRSEIREPVGS
jgi:hypothetical protein